MPAIEIRHLNGDVDVRTLAPGLPLTVGRHAACDIRTDDEGVAPIHCRLSWGAQGCEVASAGVQGVEINGVPVRQARLGPHDVLRIGSLDIVLHDPQPAAPPPAPARPAAPVEPVARSAPVPPPAPAPVPKPPSYDYSESELQVVEDDPPPSAEYAAPLKKREPPPAAVPPPRWTGARTARPGEQDVLRSPLVLTLGGGAAALLLAAATLWFVIGRQSSQRHFERAVAEMEQHNFTAAIPDFEAFLKLYPNHFSAPEARINLGRSQVEQVLAGATPLWDQGLERLKQFIDRHRDRPDFPEVQPWARRYAEQIALGAAKGAGTSRQEKWLAVSAEAVQLLQLHSPQDELPTEVLKQVAAAVRDSEAAILKHATLQKGIADMDAALARGEPLAVLDARRGLLDRYPDLAGQSELEKRLTSALSEELKRAERDAPATAAQGPETAAGPRGRVLFRQTRARADATAGGVLVFVLAGDALFAVDNQLGMPVWRRTVGVGSPFFPLSVSTDVLALLLYDTRAQELQLVRQRDGATLWRQPLGELSGFPLVHEGQIYVGTRARRLTQLDLATGRIIATLGLGQPLAGTPAIAGDAGHLVQAGERGALYTLSIRPLDCVAVTYTGHAPGAITAPLLRMGDFLLTAENDRTTSCRLSVWDVAPTPKPLKRIASVRIQGHVRDWPVLRGKQLFVPASDERISAFTVSSDRDQRVITPVGTYQPDRPQGGPTFLFAAPDDELYVAARAFQRFKLDPDGVVLLPGSVPLGAATQPPQQINQDFFVAGRSGAGRGVALTSAVARELTGQWQTLLAAPLREIAAGNDPAKPVWCVGAAGDVHGVSLDQAAQGGYDPRPVHTLALPADASDVRARQLADGRLAIGASGASSKLWLLTADGAVQRELKLAAPLEADPIALGDGVLLPLKGRLTYIGAPGAPPTAEFLLPEATEQDAGTAWRAVAAIDATQAVAVTTEGRLARYQLRTEPKRHLFEVAHADLGAPVDQLPAAAEGTLALAAGPKLLLIDAATLEIRHEAPLAAPASQAVWRSGTLVLVHVGRGRLECFDAADGLKPLWSVSLADGALAGGPVLWDGRLWLARLDGQIQAVDPANGSVTFDRGLGQALVLGPRLIHGRLVVAGLDGSLLVLNDWIDPPAAAGGN